MQKKTNLIISIIGLLVAFGLGFGIGKSTSPGLKMTESQFLSDLEGKLESKTEKGLLFLDPSYGEKIVRTSLSGEVIKREENTFTVKVANRYQGGKLFDYLNEPDYYQKTVKLEKDTEIVKLIFKETQETSLSLEDIPFPFEEKEASFLELKEGTKVFVEAKSEFDLAKTEEIPARRIEIRE